MPAQEFLDTVRSRLAIDAIELTERLRRVRCGLTGHAMVLHLEPKKMSLRCLNCGERTSGWTISPARLIVRHR
jgi:hypothetical protein